MLSSTWSRAVSAATATLLASATASAAASMASVAASTANVGCATPADADQAAAEILYDIYRQTNRLSKRQSDRQTNIQIDGQKKIIRSHRYRQITAKCRDTCRHMHTHGHKTAYTD